MKRLCSVLALLLATAGCAGLEDSIRDLNRSLYRSWAGDDAEKQRPATAGAQAGATPCFSADTGLLYVSQTGRCATGFTPVAAAEAERAFGSSRQDDSTRTSAQPQTANAASAGMRGVALCYDDGQGQIFEAASCPSGSRWINSEEAASLRQAQLAGASWCYFADRRVLYRSGACRPGDQRLDVAQADALWEKLPPDRRPRQRPAEATGGAQAMPPVQAAPRGGVSATPLPARRQ